MINGESNVIHLTGSIRVRWLFGVFALVAVMLLGRNEARAQAPYVACPPIIDLTVNRLPEIDSQGGRLRGTVVLADGQRTQVLPQTTPNAGAPKCVPQLRRYYQNFESPPVAGPGTALPPTVGPTLRGSLGDVVELTFLNQINPQDYGDTIDLSEKGIGTGCDSVTNGTGYPNFPPGTNPASDTYPNCFHGSTTGNLHFHGTHTSPSGTADNVFLGIHPSPRQNGAPVVTGASVAADFSAFFANCESKLKANNLLEWPLTWAQMGIPNWLAGQKTMLQAFDVGKPQPQQLWPADEAVDAAGGFPQYYIGSFPYCFLLPRFPGTETPPKAMVMGQAPGTMWYHAHKHGSTAIDVSNGMAGAFIIEDNSPQGYDGFIKHFYLQHQNNRKLPGQTTPAPNWPIMQTTMVVNQSAGTPRLETKTKGVPGGPAPFSINGQELPNVSMYPGEVQLWRIVNASTISGFYLPALPPGFTWRQTAQDGVQFDNFNYNSRAERPVFVAPGNRIDLLVQAPTHPGTTTNFNVLVTQGVSQSGAENTQTPTTTLMTIVLKGKGPAMPLLPVMPRRPGFLDDIAANATNAPPRALTFNTSDQASGHSQHKIAIDGGPLAKFEEGPPLTISKLGTIEQWKISNTTNGGIDHPFHIHINPFQVAEVFDPNQPLLDAHGHAVFDNGKAVPLYIFSGTPKSGQCLLNGADPSTWHPCASLPTPYNKGTNIWWDVFPIPDATTVPAGAPGAGTVVPGYFVMRTRFVDYNGSYVLHCHILAHEDRGMMLQVNLASTPAMAMMQHH
jgi:FtsP/CotA-like multicopper oxidase with cupredoxin domain